MFKMQPIKREIEVEGFHSIYCFEFSKDFTHTPEKHNFWEMVYVDVGEIIAVTNGVGCELESGRVIFHEPGEIHAHISNNRVSNNMLVISFTSHSEAMSFFRRKTFTLGKTEKTLLKLFIGEAKNALGSIPDDYAQRDDLSFAAARPCSVQLMECYFTELLLQLLRSGDETFENIHQTKTTRIIAENSISEMIKDYMEKKLYSDLNLSELCAHFLIGKSQLSKIFAENCGKSPMAYYTDMKMGEAKRLLRENELTVSEISHKLGYPSIHAFSRSFKKNVGASPTDYKKSIF